MAVGHEPIHGFDHEEIQQRGTDDGRGRAGFRAAADVGDGVAGGAAIVQDAVGDLVQFFAAWVDRGRGLRHRDATKADDRQPFLLGVERDFDGRRIFARIGDDNDGLAGEQAVRAVIALGELRAVADHVFNEAAGRVHEAADAGEAAGAADDLARDDVAVAAAEGVENAALRDGGADERAEFFQPGRIEGAGVLEQGGGVGEIAFGGRGHGDGLR